MLWFGHLRLRYQSGRPERLFVRLTFLWLACAAALGAAVSSAATPCENLTSFALKGGTITAASMVAPGAFKPPAGGPAGENAAAQFQKLPAFCRVQATLKPSADSEIGIEVWLPESGWNGKLAASGNGALAGSISFGGMAGALAAGYAVTSTDTGHVGNVGTFALGHPEKVIDFGYRAVHENAVAAKAIVEARYGSAPKRSYFQGCSTGGRQAYGEAQRYPADFDGIVGGAPGINTTHQTAMQTWVAVSAHKDEAAYIPPEKYPMFHAAVLATCDALDGVKDGVIENPLACKFDPASLLCKGPDTADCLTAPQVELARKVYAGPVSPSGKQVFTGLMPGSEQAWGLAGPKPMPFALMTYQYLVMEKPDWDYLTLDLDRDVAFADKKLAAILNNADPNIKPFLARGGKLLGYHGWADPGISPYNSINYRKSVAGVMGGESAIADSYRLFMVPGMGHCGGGDGTATFNMLAEIDRWVETGKAPDAIPAARTRNGAVDRTRPLCPFPQQAVYKGTGSTDDAANFTCAVK
jgi:feruloyl esterase